MNDIGITGFSEYIPVWRLHRKCAVDAMAWRSPSLRGLSRGTRSVCNHDEDTLTLAVAAARPLVSGKQFDAVYLSSTTFPYEERSAGAMFKSVLSMNDDITTFDMSGSRRAGVLGLLSGLDRVTARGKPVLVAAADTPAGRPGSADELLFGDGAAAISLGTDHVIARFLGQDSKTRDVIDRYRMRGESFDYVWEDRWAVSSAYIPLLTEAVNALLEKAAVGKTAISKVIFPCPTPFVHQKIGRAMGFEPAQIQDSLFSDIGETGTAHPLVMLSRALRTASPGDRLMVCGFGSGATALLFEVTNEISCFQTAPKTSPEMVVEPYTRFLTYRGELCPENGVRGEKPQKTALSVLNREQHFIMGLNGGECIACGTRQIPLQPVCVNPTCRQSGPFKPMGFADKSATIKTFTGDYLVPSLAPPHLYGMIQFEGGGRMMTEFTDCHLSDLSVGRHVTMAFRKRYEDTEREFIGYFWKGIPTTEEAP